jgi:hypothetical protein
MEMLAPNTTLTANSTTMAANHEAASCSRETLFNMMNILLCRRLCGWSDPAGATTERRWVQLWKTWAS